MKKILDVNNIKNKAIKILKDSFKTSGINLADQAEKEILNAIKAQSESNLEEMIAENLALDIIGEFNEKVKKEKNK